MKYVSARWIPWLALVAAIVLAGCAQDVGDIDRTQANAIRKDHFEGVWYYRQTVTDVPQQIDYTFIGYSSQLEKLRWEVREDFLIGYRSYELNPGTDPKAGGTVQGKTVVAEGEEGDGFDPEAYTEEPVAAFRIESHFDIQRQYNPNTGEQSNVIIENTTDRHWNEREYMRVDWSTNHVNRLFFLTDMSQISSANHFVQETEGGPDAFYREMRTDENGEPELAYFDFVNKLNLQPNMEDCRYYRRNCIPGEIKVRNSFYRLEDLERDYEPALYDDRAMNKFGYFRTEREIYDEREGFTDTKRLYYASRHDLWTNDYKRGPDGQYLRNADGDRIPTPMADRVPKPIVYYMSPNFPEPIEEYAYGIAEEWDRAFRRAVGAAKGMSAAEVEKKFGAMYVVCHNPVRDDDPASCDPRPQEARTDEEGNFEPFRVRNGDLRYNILWWVARPQAAGPLGYGPPFYDPETGEIVAGSAYMYGASVDLYAQSGVDTVKLANGDFSAEDFRQGVDITRYLEKTLDQEIDPRARIGEETWAKLGDIPIDSGQLGLRVQEQLLGPEKFAKVELLRDNDPAQVLDTNVTKHQQIMERFQRAGWDKRLLDSEMLSMFSQGKSGDSGASAASDVEIDEFLEHTNPLEMREKLHGHRAFQEKMSRHNIFPAEFADTAVVATALEFEGETDYEKVWNTIRGRIFYGVGAHEVGHSIGLRHNFQGSYDTLNFFDRYWELRQENLRTVRSLQDIYAMNAMTDTQIEEGMRHYQYSSIMDYHSRFNGDWAGIGKYDEAAILFAYTYGTYDDFDASHSGEMPQRPGFVEIFTNISDGGKTLLRQFEDRRSPTERALLENWHYSTVINRIGGASRLTERELMRWDKLRPQLAADEPDRPVEVPYMFCSDELRGALVSCNLWDLGADPLEIVQAARDNYFVYYPLTNFRRERGRFDPLGPLNKSYRTMRTFLTVYQQWLIGNQDVDDQFLNFYYILAAGAGFNTLFETMTMPRYGTYEKNEDTGKLEWDDYDMDGEVTVAMGDGRRLRSLYDASSGYYYFNRMLEAGHFWDWLGALFVAIEPVARTVAVDTAADREAYLVPFYLVFEDELTQLFNGQITEDLVGLESRVTEDGEIVRPPAFRLNVGQFAPVYIDPLSGQNLSQFEGGEPLELVSNLTQQRYAALYGVAYFNELYTQHYVDQSRVFKVGNGEQIEAGEGYEVLEFTDPTTGLKYGTVRPQGGTPEGEVPSLGEALVVRGQKLGEDVVADPSTEEERSAGFEFSRVVDTINMVNDIIKVYGGPIQR